MKEISISSLLFSIQKLAMELFDRFDANKNAELDEQETAKMNIFLFFNIPRLMNACKFLELESD